MIMTSRQLCKTKTGEISDELLASHHGSRVSHRMSSFAEAQSFLQDDLSGSSQAYQKQFGPSSLFKETGL